MTIRCVYNALIIHFSSSCFVGITFLHFQMVVGPLRPAGLRLTQLTQISLCAFHLNTYSYQTSG